MLVNINNLKGIEIVTGDNIIIPNAKRVFATTKSTTKKGKNKNNPAKTDQRFKGGNSMSFW